MLPKTFPQSLPPKFKWRRNKMDRANQVQKLQSVTFRIFKITKKNIPEPLVVRAEANHHHHQQQQQQQQRSVVFDLSPSGGEKEAATNDKSKVEYYKFRYGPKRSPCKCALVT